MRILILGNGYNAKKFYTLFKKNRENIVFTTISSFDNYIQFDNSKDIVDFCEANEINLVLIADLDLINQGLQEAISAINIFAFAPSVDSIAICSSKSYAKKFMYKNNILTPKFFIAEKPQTALDYYMTAQTPQVIKPDCNSFCECPKFCETFKQAQETVFNLFASGNKRIIIEDYVEGKAISLWTLSDGYSAKIIGSSAKYQNDVALFEPDFINDELKESILESTIIPTINSLSQEGDEYIGILGFDFILDFNNCARLIGYNFFFDDINTDFYTEGFNLNWAEIFKSTIEGDVFQKFEIKPKDSYMLTLRQNEQINFISAKTKNNLEKYLQELEFDTREYEEAKKIWKY